MSELECEHGMMYTIVRQLLINDHNRDVQYSDQFIQTTYSYFIKTLAEHKMSQDDFKTESSDQKLLIIEAIVRKIMDDKTAGKYELFDKSTGKYKIFNKSPEISISKKLEYDTMFVIVQNLVYGNNNNIKHSDKFIKNTHSYFIEILTEYKISEEDFSSNTKLYDQTLIIGELTRKIINDKDLFQGCTVGEIEIFSDNLSSRLNNKKGLLRSKPDRTNWSKKKFHDNFNVNVLDPMYKMSEVKISWMTEEESNIYKTVVGQRKKDKQKSYKIM
jgi:hypothetical protein